MEDGNILRGLRPQPDPSRVRFFYVDVSDSISTSRIEHYSFNPRKRSALPITLTDDNAIAAAATMGDSKIPKAG